MENSQTQLSSLPPPPPENPPTPHSDHRHSLVAGRFRDALFSAVAAKYATNGSGHSLPFSSAQFKSDIECRLHEYFPSFQTPTHLPYASMIQRAIAEVGEEDGLSEESISEFVVNEYEDLPWAHAAFLRRHLGKLCESGELVKSKCGRYNFKVEGKGIKRKKRRRKSVGRSRRQEVESADEMEEDFDRKKRSKKLVIIGPRGEDIVTGKRIEEQNDSLREVIVGVEDGDHAQGGQVVLDGHEELQEDEMIDEHHGDEIKNKYGPKDFDRQKQSRNLVIIGLHAPVTINGIEKQGGSLGEEVHEAEEGVHAKRGQIQVLAELKEVRADVLIDQHCEKEVKSRDGVQDFDEKKQSQPRKALTMTGTEEKCGLSREEVDGAKKGGHDQERPVIMIYELKEVRKLGMVNDNHEVEVNSRDGDEDFGGRKQLQELVVVGLHAEETLTTKGTENRRRSLREKINQAEGGRAQTGRTEVLDKFKEVQEVELIDVHHEEERQGEVMEEPTERESKGSNEEWPSEEASLEFFDAMSNHGNGEENGVIDAQGCKILQKESENLEFFDAKSDPDNGANEIICAQSSKGKVLCEVSNKQNRLQEQLLSKVSVSDDQTGINRGRKAEDPQLSKEQPQVRWPSEITGTPSSIIVASPPLEHQTETPKHAEQGMPNTSEAELPSYIICSPKSQPRGHRGRGRPQKLKVQETLATLFPSSAQDYDQQYLESNVEERETSDQNMGDGTHHVDQHRLKLPRGRGRGRGISQGREVEDPQLSKEQPQVRWPYEITGILSTSIVGSPPLEHQTETLKHAEQGMPSTSEAILPLDIICSLKSQPRGHRGRGRPRKLKVHEATRQFTSFPSSAQDIDQQYLESNVEEIEIFDPNMGDGTHHVDQQRLKLPRGRGRGRGRGRPRVVRQDQIPSSETFSPSKHLHHQQSPEKRRRGRPPKRKFDVDTVSMDVSTSI